MSTHMNPQTVTITLVPEKDTLASYFIRLEEKKGTGETVTPTEAAKVIDALYNVDPCNRQTFDTEDELVQSYEDRLKSAFGLIDYTPCKYNPNSFDYDKQVYVYRSDATLPYKLVLNTGSVYETKTEESDEDVTVEVNSNYVKLQSTILNVIYCDVKIKKFKGNVLYFTKEYIGFIRVKYKTQYDVVSLTVKGLPDQAQSCQIVAFYQGITADLTVDPPEEDDDAKKTIGCPEEEDNSNNDNPPPEPCYQRYVYSDACRCSKDIVEGSEAVSVVKEVSCDKVGASNTKEGVYNDWQEAVNVITYVPCPDKEGQWEGDDREFYKKKCCKYPPIDRTLPICQSITSNIVGGVGPPEYDPQPYSDWSVSYVPVPPKDGICGTTTDTWEVNAKNCCDSQFYTNLVYDSEDSVDKISRNSFGWVFWNGGFFDPDNPNDRSAATVTVRGTGFWLDTQYSKKTIDGYVGGARIYADSQSCGMCEVDIKDGCSSTSGLIKGTEGHWERISVKTNMKDYNWDTLCTLVDTNTGTSYGYHYRDEADVTEGRYGAALNVGSATTEPVAGRISQSKFWPDVNLGAMLSKCGSQGWMDGHQTYSTVGTCSTPLPDTYDNNVDGTGISVIIAVNHGGGGTYIYSECPNEPNYLIAGRKTWSYDTFWEWVC